MELPDSVLGWVGAFIIVVGSWLTFAEAVGRYVEGRSGQASARRHLQTAALPLGWICWIVALAYGEGGSTLSVLVALLGSLVILIVDRHLIRRPRKGVTKKSPN